MPLRPARAATTPAARNGVSARNRRPSVAVFRALQLGDMLCAVPALRAIRAALPGAQITLVGLPWAREFVARFSHYLDDFIEFPGWPGLPERDLDPRAIPAFLSRIQRRRYDLAIQMHGDGSLVNPLVALFDAAEVAGFVRPGAWVPGARFNPYPDSGREADRLLGLTTALGFPARGAELEFPLAPADLHDLREALGGAPELGSYVILHPGARASERRWDARRFAAIGDALAEQGMTVLVTGSADEGTQTAAVARAMAHPAIDLAGRTSLGALAVLIDSARLVVCNDTGVSHLAAARRTPSVVIFSASDPRRWAPADATLHRVVHAGSRGAVATAVAHAVDLLHGSADDTRSAA